MEELRLYKVKLTHEVKEDKDIQTVDMGEAGLYVANNIFHVIDYIRSKMISGEQGIKANLHERKQEPKFISATVSYPITSKRLAIFEVSELRPKIDYTMLPAGIQLRTCVICESTMKPMHYPDDDNRCPNKDCAMFDRSLRN